MRLKKLETTNLDVLLALININFISVQILFHDQLYLSVDL